MPDDLVAFLNREAEELHRLAPPLSTKALRGAIRDRLGEAFHYPFEATVRGLVAGDRHEQASHGREAPLVTAGGTRFLELVPEGLTREAAGLIGPILIATDRPLQAGSVIRVRLVFEDPRKKGVIVPGLHARVDALEAEVAVEP